MKGPVVVVTVALTVAILLAASFVIAKVARNGAGPRLLSENVAGDIIKFPCDPRPATFDRKILKIRFDQATLS